MRMQYLFVILGGVFPALINFFTITYSVNNIDGYYIGQVFFLSSVCYLIIDIFNIGTTRIASVTSTEEQNLNLFIIDLILGGGASLVFLFVTKVLNYINLIDVEITMDFVYLTPFFYAMAHLPLGLLRSESRNSHVLFVLMVNSLSRLILIFCVNNHILENDFLLDFWIGIDILYGMLMFLFSLKYTSLSFSNDINLMKLFSDSNLIKKIFESWRLNIISIFSKHADIIILQMLHGPVLVSIYRPFKSIYNLSYNFGNSLAIPLSKDKLWEVLLKFRGVISISLVFFGVIFSYFISSVDFIGNYFSFLDDIFIYISGAISCAVVVLFNRLFIFDAFKYNRMKGFKTLNYSLIESVNLISIVSISLYIMPIGYTLWVLSVSLFIASLLMGKNKL